MIIYLFAGCSVNSVQTLKLTRKIILIKPRCVCVREQITRAFMRKVRKIEIWFFREKVFMTICRVIENMAEVD